jgi:predicted histone-like DNA-binding protein
MMKMFTRYSVITPTRTGPPKKYYPSIQSSGRKSLRQLSKRIGEISMVRRSDVLAMIDAMLYVIPEELAEGNIVELGDFGSFSRRTPGRCG